DTIERKESATDDLACHFSVPRFCRLDGGHVDFPHLHHRREDPPGDRRIGVGDALKQNAWRDLPGNAPAVLAPAAGALLPAIADEGVPVAVRLLLVLGDHLEGEGLR